MSPNPKTRLPGADRCTFCLVNFFAQRISGLNLGAWRQVGPCTGIDSGDQMWMSRYILQRVAELYNVEATFDPKPIPGDWNGAGGHTNYSTTGTRAAGTGWECIQKMIGKLEKRHAVHIAGYGEGNERRLTGLHETSSMDSFRRGPKSEIKFSSCVQHSLGSSVPGSMLMHA